jgi:hypothetical protein
MRLFRSFPKHAFSIFVLLFGHSAVHLTAATGAECRSQWPCGLRRRSSAARLLRSWVRNQPGAWMFVCLSVVCCQVEISAMDWSLVQRSPTDCGGLLCVIKKPRNEEAKSRYRAVENTTTMGCNARKTNKQTNRSWATKDKQDKQ